jgi:hypothetical protein
MVTVEQVEVVMEQLTAPTPAQAGSDNTGGGGGGGNKISGTMKYRQMNTLMVKHGV